MMRTSEWVCSCNFLPLSRFQRERVRGASGRSSDCDRRARQVRAALAASAVAEFHASPEWLCCLISKARSSIFSSFRFPFPKGKGLGVRSPLPVIISRILPEFRSRLRCLPQQLLRLFQVAGLETLSEPCINRRDEIARLVTTSCRHHQPPKAVRRTEFPRLRALLTGNPQRGAEKLLGGRRVLVVEQNQFTANARDFRFEHPHLGPLHAFRQFIERASALGNFAMKQTSFGVQ